MKRVIALLVAAALALVVAAPVAAQGEQYVTDITITSATVDRTGQVVISGYLYCHNMDWWNIEIQGQLRQAIGHKTTIQGDIGGGLQCTDSGPSYFQAWASAYNGTFAPGWATVNIKFGTWNYNENGQWWQDFGGQNFYLKLTKK